MFWLFFDNFSNPFVKLLHKIFFAKKYVCGQHTLQQTKLYLYIYIHIFATGCLTYDNTLSMSVFKYMSQVKPLSQYSAIRIISVMLKTSLKKMIIIHASPIYMNRVKFLSFIVKRYLFQNTYESNVIIFSVNNKL